MRAHRYSECGVKVARWLVAHPNVSLGFTTARVRTRSIWRGAARVKRGHHPIRCARCLRNDASAALTGEFLAIAHRGDSAAHLENTLLAFEEAIAAGADLIETDLRLRLDGIVVCGHDRDLARVARLPEWPV